MTIEPIAAFPRGVAFLKENTAMNSRRFYRCVLAAAILLGGCVGLLSRAQAAAAPRSKVVVISLDAFGARSLAEPELPAPTCMR